MQVTKGKKWADLGRYLGYTGISGLSTQIKNSYTRVILPYEHWCEHVRASPLASLATTPRGDSQLRTHTNTQKRTWSAGSAPNSAKPEGDESMSPPDSPLTATSSPLSEPPEESEVKEEPDETAPRRRRGRASTSSEQKTR
jgi:histone demethylase JARID1